MFYEHQGGWCQGEGLNVTKKLGRVCVSLSHLVVVVVVAVIAIVVVVVVVVVMVVKVAVVVPVVVVSRRRVQSIDSILK